MILLAIDPANVDLASGLCSLVHIWKECLNELLIHCIIGLRSFVNAVIHVTIDLGEATEPLTIMRIDTT